jgi:hypothetical protein
MSDNRYVYKAIFSKENLKEEYKKSPYWILSHTGIFDGKLHSRGKYIKSFLKDYQPLNIKIEFIKYVSSEKEFQEVINQNISDKYCMNNLIRKNYGKNAKRGPLSEDARKKFNESYKRTKQINFDNLKSSELVFSIGKNKKIFKFFDEFYDFVKKEIKPRKKEKFNLNWDNEKIKEKFLVYFNNNKYTTRRKLENLCRFDSFSQMTEKYWLDRGWDINYAKQKISEIQSYFSFKSVKSMTDDRFPTQLKYWLKKGFSEDDAKKKRSEFQNRGSYVSQTSLKLFFPFYQKYKNVYSCYIHQKADSSSHEFGIWADNKLYCYDFTIKELGLIFEFNGLHVHPKKEKLKEKWSEWRHYYTKETADEIQEKYDKKLRAAHDKNFSVIQLWEDEKDNQLKIKEAIALAIASI